MSKEDPFGTGAREGRPEPKRDRWGRYVLTHPITGKEQSWMRTTTFTKKASDTFNLEQWQQRNVAKGLSLRPDLLALASTMDISRDAKKLNQICEDAKEAAGSRSAANTGTALHAFTETWDDDGRSDVPEMYQGRLFEYQAALDRHGITILPEYIERIIVNTTYDVAGTFDRIVKLSDGTYAIFDLKTGKSIDYGKKEMEIQLAVYADAFNEHGVWDASVGRWIDVTFELRTDFGIIAHLPASGSGCTLHKLDLENGRRGARVCQSVREYQAGKRGDTEWIASPGIEASDSEVQSKTRHDAPSRLHWLWEINEAESKAALMGVVAKCREAGMWEEELADQARRKNLILPS